MNNPYNSLGNEELSDSFVCFADILGFTNLCEQAIKNKNGNQFLKIIKESIEKAYEFIDPVFHSYENRYEYSIKVFTDNIVIGYPLSNPLDYYGEHELARILDGFSAYQLKLALDGFYLRGAISFGKNYMDDLIVFGDALIDAHRIEEKGGPPRIVLSQKALAMLKKQIVSYFPPTNAPQFNMLLKDIDGAIFMNYLHLVTIAESEGFIDIDILNEHRYRIKENLESHSHEPNILSKYEWLANYHNYFCCELARKYEKSISDVMNPENYDRITPEISKTNDLINELRNLIIDVPPREITRISMSDLKK